MRHSPQGFLSSSKTLLNMNRNQTINTYGLVFFYSKLEAVLSQCERRIVPVRICIALIIIHFLHTVLTFPSMSFSNRKHQWSWHLVQLALFFFTQIFIGRIYGSNNKIKTQKQTKKLLGTYILIICTVSQMDLFIAPQCHLFESCIMSIFPISLSVVLLIVNTLYFKAP